MLFSNQQTLVSNQPTWAVGMKIDYKGQIKWMPIQKCAVIFRNFFGNINNVSNVWFFSQAETNVWVMYEWWPSCKTSAPLHCNGEGRSLGLVKMKQYWHSFFSFLFFLQNQVIVNPPESCKTRFAFKKYYLNKVGRVYNRVPHLNFAMSFGP